MRAVVRGLLGIFGIRADQASHLFSVQGNRRRAGHRPVQRHRPEGRRDILMGALDLGERSVEEIMLHRSGIQMIDAELAADEVLERVLKSSHTRLPVYRGERENVIGVIHAKDLLRGVRKAIREGGPPAGDEDRRPQHRHAALFVPDTTPLDEQMRNSLARRAFRAGRRRMAACAA